MTLFELDEALTAPEPVGRLSLVPLHQSEAFEFVARWHRHNTPPVGSVFQVGVADEQDQLVGVLIAGRPVARALDNGRTLELSRCCSLGYRNACSMLYSAGRRAAVALGYDPRRVYTYTLQSEPGSSLRAAGFVVDAVLDARGRWDCPSRPRPDDPSPVDAKVRWRAAL